MQCQNQELRKGSDFVHEFIEKLPTIWRICGCVEKVIQNAPYEEYVDV